MSATTDDPRMSGPGAWVDPDVDPTSTHAQFDGDLGGLDLAQRRALVVLVKNRFVTPESHPEEWRALLERPDMIRARLNDMFLGLRLDTEHEVAFKYQVTSDSGDRFPTLLHATEWTREETILLVHLRATTHATYASGQPRCFVDRQDLLEHIASVRPASATDQVRDLSRARRAVESLVSAGLLLGRKDADRFEVARAIEALLPLELMQQLLTWIRSENLPADDPASTDLDGADL